MYWTQISLYLCAMRKEVYACHSLFPQEVNDDFQGTLLSRSGIQIDQEIKHAPIFTLDTPRTLIKRRE